MKKQVLLIEDDDALRQSLAQTLDLEGITVILADGFAQARRAIRSNFNGVILSDIRMPGKDGFDVLDYVKSVDKEIPVILLTGEADVPMALRAMREGAYDFLEKPCATDNLLQVIERALKHRALVTQSRVLEAKLQSNDPASLNFVGNSPVIKKFRESLRKLSQSDINVLFTGAAGVGKKQAAYTLHSLIFVDGPNIALNLERQEGLRDLPSHAQPESLTIKSAELLTEQDQEQLLQLKKKSMIKRFFFTSQVGLKDLTEHHLSTEFAENFELIELVVPDLRQRRKDLPVLFETTLRQTARLLNLDVPTLSSPMLGEIMSRDWPGNLPELREYAQKTLLGEASGSGMNPDQSLNDQLQEFEKLVLSQSLKRFHGKATQAASALDLPRKTFYDRLARYGLRPADFKSGKDQP